ncbi:MAG: histidine phosphatase family protein [Gammaproteobacteria bacterium]|nr:histidine phosphatase family protein [Gammaproteobacteria bacterium]MDH5694197.1 histidine phosphatase family protein [Gammaproteobacteria bacterium]
MSRELLILRHGESGMKSGASDFQRVLNDRGVQSVQELGAWMAEHLDAPDRVLSSSALRACQTAVGVCSSMGIVESEITFLEELYLASTEIICKVLSGVPSNTQRVLLVGHNPGLEDLIELLLGKTGARTVPVTGLSPATLVQIAINTDWAGMGEGCGELMQVRRP